jgi:NAD+ diphosphatase
LYYIFFSKKSIWGKFLDNCAFFFQGASLLLPEGASAPVSMEIPLIHAKDLPVSDRFTVPDIAGSVISGIVVPPEVTLPPHWQTIPVRQVLSVLSGENTAARLLRTFHIAQWRRESLFCGSCGGKNTDTDTEETARLCPVCGRMEFPRISPAVIVLITNNEGKILLAHNTKFAPGLYSLLAGFVEAGVTLEAAAIRETREESGIEICGLQYLASQPWPFPNSLTMGFSARHTAGSITVDGIEIEDVQWFSRDSLPALPGPGSLSRRLIERWLNGTTNQTILPFCVL